MSNQYKIELKLDSNWADVYWVWAVYKGKKKVWSGISEYKWTARRAAVNAARKYDQGMRQSDSKDPNYDEFWYSV